MSRALWLHLPGLSARGRVTPGVQRLATGLVLPLALVLLPPPGPASAQGAPLPIEAMPLSQYGGAKSGATVTPVYEGWYETADGESNVIYFGYYNRNTEEVVDVPVGSNNRLDGWPGGADGGQPTRFEAGRHWGVFGVRVPRDFDGSVVWHLSLRGQTFEIPGELREDWSTPAISGDAIGDTPPWVRFEEEGPEGWGPGGIWATETRTAHVGVPVPLSVWTHDDGVAGEVGAPAVPGPLALTWIVHRGSDDVAFDPGSGRVPVEGGVFETRVTFPQQGEYVLRVRLNDATGVAPAGHEQCCWTNGFVRYLVTP